MTVASTASMVESPARFFYTAEEVAAHRTADDCWIIYKDAVCNVTEFLEGHPGGPDIILMYGGKEVTALMNDPTEHSHSDFAFQMLEAYRIGTLRTIDDGERKQVASEGVLPDPNFLDISKPLFWQMWKNNFTKNYYLEQVHIARHVKDGSSAPIFGGILEYITLTPWYVIPAIWLPVACAWFSFGKAVYGWGAMVAMVLIGLAHWTLVEYLVHRAIFHVDGLLPDHPKAFAVHFLAHGVHHFLPMDRFRLVMPPALFTSLMVPVFTAYNTFLPTDFCYAVGSGTLLGYVCYDLCHYFLHHGRPITTYLRELKTYHLNHHYKNADLGFGITSKFWDRLFGTELLDHSLLKAE